jgi:hypothetical protein
MRKFVIALACTAALCAVPAAAAVILNNDGVVLESGPPFDGGGSVPDYDPVYNNSEVSATEVNGDLAPGPTTGSLVTFTSSDNLELFGNSNGHAQIVGPFSDLVIDPALLFNAIDYSLITGPGDSIFADIEVLLYGGGSAFFTDVELSGNDDRFRIYGTEGELFESIIFNFTAPVNSIEQVKIQTASVNGAVPEPSTWAMLLLGFGAVGASLRRKPKTRIRLQLA